MSTKMDENDWAHTLAVFRACLPRRGRKAEDDRRFLEALHFFTVENVRWRAAGALRSLEQRVEALRSLEQGWRLRGVLRHSGIHEFDGASHSDVRLDHRARAWVGGRSKRGQEGRALGRSRGGFTTKIHAKSDAYGDIIAFDLTGGEASDGRHFETLLDIGPDIQPCAAISRQRLRQQRQPRGDKGARRCAGHPAQGQRKRQAGLLRANPLQGKGSHRTGRRTAQAVQARRAPLRKDRTKLQIHRRLRRRPLLDQIRPHRLGARPDSVWTGVRI